MKEFAKRKANKLAIVALSCGLLLMDSTVGQTLAAKHVVESNANACELNSLYLDNLIAEAKKNKERIFVVSRISKKEKYRVNSYRLEDAYTYIITRELSPDQIVVAIGGRTSDKKGRIEFYLGSQLYLVSLADNGKPLCLTCCDSP